MSAVIFLTAPAAALAANGLLAQSGAPDLRRVVVPLAALLVLAAILLSVLWIVRRRMRMENGPAITRGFSLGDLRDLHREGKISTEEFERAKALLVASVHSGLKKDAKASKVEPLNSEPK